MRSQPAIGIYTNTADQVVLVREREWNEEEDAFVLISCEHAPKVAQAILEAAGFSDIEFVRNTRGGLYEDFDVDGSVQTLSPKDKTAAERQRRRRARLRDGDDRDSVTVTNGHALPLLEYTERAG